MAEREGILGRIKAATTAFWRPSRVDFGPAEPIHPSTNEDIRRQDYLIGRNLLMTPRAAEGRSVTYQQMRSLARIHTVTRTVIEKRKDEIKGLEWNIRVKADAGAGYEAEVPAVRKFWEKPDGWSTFDQWIGTLMEDIFVIDAPCIYKNFDMLGRLGSLDIVDGATILVLVDDQGRIPRPPRPAYEQIIKGLPRTWWTADELTYTPYNTSSDGVYGFSHVESIIMTVNIAMRRDMSFLEWFRSSNVPKGLIEAPEGWTPTQIDQFQTMFDTYLQGDLAQRSKLIAVPGKAQMLEQLTFDAIFDEWLARIVCARFGVSPAPYVRMMNRGTAQTIEEASLEESLVPLMQHLKASIDQIISEDMHKPYLEFVWTSGQLHYKLADAQINKMMLEAGAITLDDWRELKGEPPLPNGMGSHNLVWTGSGPVKLEDVLSGKFAEDQKPPVPPAPMPQSPFGAPAQSAALAPAGGPIDGQMAGGFASAADSPYTLSLRAMKAELDQWQDFTIRRLGKKTNRPFEPRLIPKEMGLMIAEALTQAPADAEAVKGVFDVARNNLNRRRTPSVDQPMSALMAEYEGKLRAAVLKTLPRSGLK